MAHSATLETTQRFGESLKGLTEVRAKSARKALKFFAADTHYGKLNFEKLKGLPPYCTIRTGRGDRVLLKALGGGHYRLIDVGSHDFIYRAAASLS